MGVVNSHSSTGLQLHLLLHNTLTCSRYRCKEYHGIYTETARK